MLREFVTQTCLEHFRFLSGFLPSGLAQWNRRCWDRTEEPMS